MRIIPVLDVKSGQAVHARGGERDHYGPLDSIFHPGTDPIFLAQAMRGQLGLDEMYLADLDALAGKPPATELFRHLILSGTKLWVDAGVRTARECESLLQLDPARVILALESLEGPAVVEEVLQSWSSQRLAFSLDLFGGRVVRGAALSWASDDPLAIARRVIDAGMECLIVLDVAQVGTGRGAGTLPLLAEIRALSAELELVAGGGVAGREDLAAIEKAGASAVLVGSALHDGRLLSR